MIKYIKNSNKKRIVLIFLVEIFILFLFFHNEKTKVIIEVNDNQFNGTMQIYYAQEKEFVEGKSVIQNINSSQDKIEFIIPLTDIQKMRIVLYSLNKLDIKGITIINNGIKTVYNIPAIYNSITYKQQMEVNKYEDYIELKSLDKALSPYIDFGCTIVSIQKSIQILIFLQIFLLLVLLTVCLDIIINFICLNLYSNPKILRLILFCIVASAIFIIDYEVITKINNTKETYYEIKTSETDEYSVLNETIITSFRAVSNKLLSYQIFLSKNSKVEGGKIEYELINSLNEIIYKKEISNIEEIFSKEECLLNFELKSEKFVRGEIYQLVMKYSLDNSISIEVNSDGNIHGRQIFSFRYHYLFYIIIGFINLIAGIYIVIIFRKGFNDKNIISLAIVSGILLCFIIAPCNIADEYRHFVRAYDITEGNIFRYLSYYKESYGNVIMDDNGLASYAEVPEEINQLRLIDNGYNYNERSYVAEMNYGISIDKLFQILFSPQTEDKVSVSLAATSKISFFSYLPQILFIGIGKILGLRPIILYYMARMGNTLAISGLFYIVLKLLPKYKKVFIILYFTPYFSILRSSCSTDGLLIILVLIEIAYIIKMKENKEKINIKKILLIIGINSYIASMKLPYSLVVASMLILCPQNYKKVMDKKKVIFYNIGIIFIAIFISLFSYIAITGLNNSKQYDLLSNEEVDQIQMNESSSFMGITKDHIVYILEQPKLFLSMIWKECLSLDRYQVAINGWDYSFGILYILLFLMIMLDKRKLEHIYRMYLLLLSLAIWLLIFFVGYTWKNPDIGYIWGVSGKYFIPILPIVVFSLPNGNERTENVLELIYPTIILFSLFGSLLKLLFQFWI